MTYKALFIKKINKMNQDKSNAYATVINYHFYITLDDVSKFQEIEKIFHPLTENHSVTKTFLISNKKQKNKIIIGDKDEELTKNSNNIEANEEKSSLNEENGENINNYVEAPKEQISIEISELENNFLNKKRYFEVDRKKTGRKPKDSNSKSYHTKYSHDNMIIQKILPLKGEISQNNTIKFNTQFLNTKLKDIFSNTEFNGKFSSYGENYNKNVIDTIYNNNIRELIEIFELTFLEMFNIFKDTNETKFNDFDKLNTVVEEIKIKENDNYYAELFQSVAMNFENYYFKKTPRK